MPVSNLGAFKIGTPKLPNIPILGGIFGSTWPWVMESLDQPGIIVVGDFFPESMIMNKGGTFSQVTSLNRNKPVTQYSSGKLTTISFNALLFARHFLDKLEDRVKQILAMPERDEELKRPQVWLFESGPISLQCVVTSVGGVKVSEVRNNGSFRSVEFSMALQEYVPFSISAIKQSTPGTPEPSTRYKKVKQGDTYEKVAKSEYGDPMKGIHIRTINTPEVGLELEVGEELTLLPPENSAIRKAVEPVSTQISRGSDSIKQLFDERSGPGVSHAFRS